MRRALIIAALLAACDSQTVRPEDKAAQQAQEEQEKESTQHAKNEFGPIYYDTDLGTCVKVFNENYNNEHRLAVDCQRVCAHLARSVLAAAGCPPRP